MPNDFKLAGPILIERKEAETSDWAYQCNAPEAANTPEPLEAFLRNIATAPGGPGGYAWRAVTERGEVIRVYSVFDLWRELRGKETCITLHPLDQFLFRVARVRLGLAA
jgi:hypothetical protein